jgi:anti-anti-sigma factor
MLEAIHENNSAMLRILRDKLDMYSVIELNSMIRDHLQSQPHTVVLDLEQVGMIDSSAIGMLFALQQLINSYGGNMILVNLTDQVLKVLRAIRALELFTSYDSVEEALKAVQTAA